ncbi:hypothetical protein CEUSTIGMA_g3425.t1 [Chlamydomonas eustigma]|uniref:Uncharacterized protein n=1 Tax=Chlamydomonas eustigma TaxID=1157962 RepID=A0A250WZD9_9CHLO|nr:hypothetical protein CEUSTIGMA_g3425.t1 [Chlamydomonas eustigma]|eukprot:GAX75982.1 hypothetical protein CEUSTIGMA_g3425.t1 [Chlamydomonas eustigma]
MASSAASTFSKKGCGLSAAPSEALSDTELSILELSENKITVIPEGYLANLKQLTRLDLRKNLISTLPDDIGLLQHLKFLDISNNQMITLPNALWTVTALEELQAGHNKIKHIPEDIMRLSNLQVLGISHNLLEFIPSEMGWLPLTKLDIDGNEGLRMPKVVQERGFRAIICYLQVICEQHKLVEEHLDKFANQPGQAAEQAQQKMTREDVPSEPSKLEEMISAKLNAATTSGVVDLRYVATPEALEKLPSLASSVYVADVRHNCWDSLPAAILALPQLVVLNASDNVVEQVAEGVVPEHLGVLNLSFNKIKVMPKALGNSPVLQQMYLANNALTDLPSSYANLPMVDLFLSENQFTTIPKAVFGMAQLAKLSIACCRIKEVPDGISEVSTLRFLDLSFNELTDLPASLKKLSTLMALNISFNPLKAFPEVIALIPSLKELNLDYTDIKGVHPGIGNLRHLEGLQLEGLELPSPLDAIYASNPLQLVQLHNTTLTSLDLSDLGLSIFPTQLSRLTGLTALNLSKNDITTLPEELGLMTNLKALNTSSNPLRSPFSQVKEVFGELALIEFCNKAADKMDLTNCGLEELPEEVKSHAGALQQIKLGNNKLKTIPAWISSFKNLNTVVLDSNALKELPMDIMELPKLVIVMASSNAITSIPANLGDFVGLQALILHGNKVSVLPPSVGRLPDLKALSVSANCLTSLPEELGLCTALRLLDMSGNEISALPRSLGKLTRLRTFKAAANKLTTMPQEMLQATMLTEVAFSGNQFPVSEEVVLDASDAATSRRVIKLLVKASPKAANEPVAPEPSSSSLETSIQVPDPALDETAPLLKRIDQLEEEVKHPVAQVPQPDVEIKTKANEAVEAEDAEERAKKEAALKETGKKKWMFVQKHLETIAQDPLRPKKNGWDSIPLMHVPRIIAAISNPPPPPARDPESGGGPPTRRPQNMVRFKRVVQQSAMAMQLLNRVNDALQTTRKEMDSRPSTTAPPVSSTAAASPALQSPAKPTTAPLAPAPLPPPGYGYYPNYPPPGYAPPPPGYYPYPTAPQPGATGANTFNPSAPPPPGYYPYPPPYYPPPQSSGNPGEGQYPQGFPPPPSGWPGYSPSMAPSSASPAPEPKPQKKVGNKIKKKAVAANPTLAPA